MLSWLYAWTWWLFIKWGNTIRARHIFNRKSAEVIDEERDVSGSLVSIDSYLAQPLPLQLGQPCLSGLALWGAGNPILLEGSRHFWSSSFFLDSPKRKNKSTRCFHTCMCMHTCPVTHTHQCSYCGPGDKSHTACMMNLGESRKGEG